MLVRSIFCVINNYSVEIDKVSIHPAHLGRELKRGAENDVRETRINGGREGKGREGEGWRSSFIHVPRQVVLVLCLPVAGAGVLVGVGLHHKGVRLGRGQCAMDSHLSAGVDSLSRDALFLLSVLWMYSVIDDRSLHEAS
ncbi:hypothetical protein CRG98_016925 [Punica granatum]|uniref:Uncharacterized protein n=1 Tax=Punica granatum TaxID=22663 RepID=A0A2I0K272_PUNGR|nr:hypothetical protein CRG98_016925 [Punica granatum]